MWQCIHINARDCTIGAESDHQTEQLFVWDLSVTLCIINVTLFAYPFCNDETCEHSLYFKSRTVTCNRNNVFNTIKLFRLVNRNQV